jgi:hypothetical protein
MARRRRDSARTADTSSVGDFAPPPADTVPGSLPPGPDVTPLGATPVGKEPPVSHISPSTGGPVPSLVGSLSVFDLASVLSWLASSSKTGELQVASERLEGRLWLMQGELSNAQVGKASTIGEAVFELARIDDGSFQYTDGQVSSSGEAPVPVAAVLSEVGANVEEWRAIRRVVPVGAVVALCSDPPDHDVKIRSDQWRVLTRIGAGDKTVEQVIEMGVSDQIVAIRALRDLHLAGLITIDTAAEGTPARAPQRGSDPDDVAEIPTDRDLSGSSPLDEQPAGGTADDVHGDHAAEATADDQTPSDSDPWANLASANTSSDNGVA